MGRTGSEKRLNMIWKSSLFSHRLNYEQRCAIIKELDKPEWQAAYDDFFFWWMRKKALITPEAIKLARRLKDELNIEVFPAIVRLNINFKAWGEACRFEMINKEISGYNDHLSFEGRVREFIHNIAKTELYISNKFHTIGVQQREGIFDGSKINSKNN